MIVYMIVLSVKQVMIPNNYAEFIGNLTLLVKDNIIPMSRIDDAVKRILRVKFTMGLFENPLADLSLVNQLGSQVTLIFRNCFNSWDVSVLCVILT